MRLKALKLFVPSFEMFVDLGFEITYHGAIKQVLILFEIRIRMKYA